MEFVEFQGGQFRLAKSNEVARSTQSDPLYRLFVRSRDEFGNFSFNMTWDGRKSASTAGLLAHELFNALNATR